MCILFFIGLMDNEKWTIDNDNCSQITHTIPGGICMRKEKEEKPLSEEIMDPKPPIIKSGHMENRRNRA